MSDSLLAKYKQVIIGVLIGLSFFLLVAMHNGQASWKTRLNRDVESHRQVKGNEKYDFNIIFIETHFTRTELDNHELCAIESAAMHNRNARVTLYTLKHKTNTAVVQNYYENVFIDLIDLDTVFIDTPMEQWWKNGKLTNQNIHMKILHLSDALRLVYLFRYGGLYIDLDMYTLSSYTDLIGRDSVCYSYVHGKPCSGLPNGFLIGTKGSQFYWECMRFYVDNYNPFEWAVNGPGVVTNVTMKYCKINKREFWKIYVGDKTAEQVRKFKFDYNSVSNDSTCGVYLLPSYIAYPYLRDDTPQLYVANSSMYIHRYIYNRA